MPKKHDKLTSSQWDNLCYEIRVLYGRMRENAQPSLSYLSQKTRRHRDVVREACKMERINFGEN